MIKLINKFNKLLQSFVFKMPHVHINCNHYTFGHFTDFFLLSIFNRMLFVPMKLLLAIKKHTQKKTRRRKVKQREKSTQ